MNKANVWMLIPTFHPVIGGAQTQVQQLSQVLLAQGWEVCVVTRQHCYAHLDGLPPVDVFEGTPIRRLFSRGGTKLGSLLYLLGGLWFLLRQGRGHIYHAHDISAAGWLAVLARWLLGGYAIVKLRTGRNAYEQMMTSKVARWQFLTMLRMADRVVVVNREVQALLRRLGIPSERIVLIPNAVDSTRFAPVSAANKTGVRQRLGLPIHQTLVLYVGRFEQMKGVDVLLHGWARLPAALRQEATLVLVGDGPESTAMQQLCTRLAIAESVLLTGARSNVLDYYQAADLFVLPSRTEGLSNALLEAMACALPVLASDVGGALDVMTEGKEGYFFPADDSQALSQKLAFLLQSPAQWKAMGQQGRQRVVAYADGTAILAQFRGLYQELLRSQDASTSGAGLPAKREKGASP